MPLYALIASDTDLAVDVFVRRADAEAALRAALGYEPGFADLLRSLRSATSRRPAWLVGGLDAARAREHGSRPRCGGDLCW
jgi:hypothetical protein